MDYIIERLKEGSTWAGLAALTMALSFVLPHAAEWSNVVLAIGVVFAGTAIVVPK